jgi:hypothetical protein
MTWRVVIVYGDDTSCHDGSARVDRGGDADRMRVTEGIESGSDIGRQP